MPDTNMNTTYSWANKLAGLSHLNMTLDINQRIQLILDIEGEVDCYSKYDPSGSGSFENFSDALNSIDDIQDPIYRAGVESAPLFKKTKQQCFSFNGISLTSPVRRNSN